MRYAASLLGWSAQDADDVVQDALVAALTAIRGGARPRDLRPWLYRIVRNRAIDEVRRARRRDASLSMPPAPPARRAQLRATRVAVPRGG